MLGSIAELLVSAIQIQLTAGPLYPAQRPSLNLTLSVTARGRPHLPRAIPAARAATRWRRIRIHVQLFYADEIEIKTPATQTKIWLGLDQGEGLARAHAPDSDGDVGRTWGAPANGERVGDWPVCAARSFGQVTQHPGRAGQV